MAPGDDENNAISAKELNTFLKINHVDYVKETDFHPIFRLFDKDRDGNLDFDDFLQFVLPYDDIRLRAKITQRQTYKCKELPFDVEFELSRLIEKEIHYHVKVEEEKKTLERQADFNTTACFTVIDVKGLGFIDFEKIGRAHV